MRKTKTQVSQVDEGALATFPILGELAADVRSFTENACLRAAQTVNAELVLLYWRGSTERRTGLSCRVV